MIEVTRLDGERMVINGDLIERIEARPDTIVSLTTGRKFIVRETIADLLHRLISYRQAVVDRPLTHLVADGAMVMGTAPEPLQAGGLS